MLDQSMAIRSNGPGFLYGKPPRFGCHALKTEHTTIEGDKTILHGLHKVPNLFVLPILASRRPLESNGGREELRRLHELNGFFPETIK